MMNSNKLLFGILFLLLVSGMAAAFFVEPIDPEDMPDSGSGSTTADVGNITTGLCELYNLVEQLLAVVVFVLIVLAAIIYAAGQVLGAETRARASVWATSMIIGAVIGIVIYIVVPIVLGTMLGHGQALSSVCVGSG